MNLTKEKILQFARKAGHALKEQWFLFGMLGAIVLAYLVPEFGQKGGPLHPEYVVSYGVICLVFFLTGLSLRLAALKNAFMSWKHQLGNPATPLLLHHPPAPYPDLGVGPWRNREKWRS